MPKFEFTDGSEIEFEIFQPTGHYIYAQDSTNLAKSRGPVSISIQTTTEDYNYWYNNHYSTTKQVKKGDAAWKTRMVGLLAHPTQSGIPRGVFVPLKINEQTRAWELDIDSLVTEEVYVDNRLSSITARERLGEHNKKVAARKKEAAEATVE
jgi:hypothetical protein